MGTLAAIVSLHLPQPPSDPMLCLAALRCAAPQASDSPTAAYAELFLDLLGLSWWIAGAIVMTQQR